MNEEKGQVAGIVVFLMWKSIEGVSKFLLILRDKDTLEKKISNPDTWHPITGGVDKGETYKEAAQRELREEIGFVPKKLKALGVSERCNGYFYGVITDKEKEAIVLGEGQRYDFFSYQDLPPNGAEFSEEIKGAFRTFLDKFPKIFQAMSEESYEPEGEDFVRKDFMFACWPN